MPRAVSSSRSAISAGDQHAARLLRGRAVVQREAEPRPPRARRTRPARPNRRSRTRPATTAPARSAPPRRAMPPSTGSSSGTTNPYSGRGAYSSSNVDRALDADDVAQERRDGAPAPSSCPRSLRPTASASSDGRGSGRGAEGRLEHHRAGQVTARDVGVPVGADRPVAGVRRRAAGRTPTGRRSEGSRASRSSRPDARARPSGSPRAVRSRRSVGRSWGVVGPAARGVTQRCTFSVAAAQTRHAECERRSVGLVKLTDVQHRVVDIDPAREHTYNQVNVRRLRSGRLVAVYNEERWRFHHDSGQTVMIVSDDDGATWGDRASCCRTRRRPATGTAGSASSPTARWSSTSRSPAISSAGSTPSNLRGRAVRAMRYTATGRGRTG